MSATDNQGLSYKFFPESVGITQNFDQCDIQT